MRIAFTADWLTTNGGAEQVLSEFRALYPQAPFFTTVTRPGAVRALEGADVRVSNLQRWYKVLRNHQLLLSKMPAASEASAVRG